MALISQDDKSRVPLGLTAAFSTDKHSNDKEVKPVVVIMSDGGPDGNPRYPKVIAQTINHFKTHDLDAMFVITNAPGRNAYNRVERRMVPLSRELSGLILPHDHYGSHLSDDVKTIDAELEIKNFAFAGNTLAEVWSSMVIDQYPVTAEYVSSECTALEPELVSPEWYNIHVRESQYFLQVRHININNFYHVFANDSMLMFFLLIIDCKV